MRSIITIAAIFSSTLFSAAQSTGKQVRTAPPQPVTVPNTSSTTGTPTSRPQLTPEQLKRVQEERKLAPVQVIQNPEGMPVRQTMRNGGTAIAGSAISTSGYDTVPNDPFNTRIYTLENGLKVFLSVNKDAPRIQTFIAVKAGSKFDPATNHRFGALSGAHGV
jgi:hypothetical protein